MDLILSAVWVGKSPKSTNFGVSTKTELLAKFTLLYVGDFVRDCFHAAYATEIGCRVFIYGRK